MIDYAKLSAPNPEATAKVIAAIRATKQQRQDSERERQARREFRDTQTSLYTEALTNGDWV
jgi:hypothetical protein